MKKYFISILILLSLSSIAQEEMSMIWEKKMDHSIDYVGRGNEGEFSYAANDKEMSVFKNDDGSIVWTKKFKEIAPGLRKIDELVPFWESDIVFFFDRKMGEDKVACIELKTGKLLWETSKYQDLSEDNIVYIPEKGAFALSIKRALVFIDARTGEELWETEKFKGVVGKYIYFPGKDEAIMVNFMPTNLGALFSGFKNQIMKIQLSTGNILWEQTYIGRAERKVLTGEFLYDIEVMEKNVFLHMNGIQVYDFETGVKQWSAAYDFTPDIVREPMGSQRFGVYGAVAEPVIVGNDVYVLDMSNKRNQFVKKYDRTTGKLIWTSPEIKEARAIPNMGVIGDKIVLQVGGAVECQAFIRTTQRNSDGTTTIVTERRIWYPNIKPVGVQAFNTADGSLAWDSERFKKGITNMLFDKENVYVCSGKALYKIDYNTGEPKYEVELKEDGIGLATLVLDFENTLIVVGEKGISRHSFATGALESSAKYKASELEAVKGNTLMMKTAKADIAAYDMRTCKYFEFKAKTGASTMLQNDGKFVYVFENKVVTKLNTDK